MNSKSRLMPSFDSMEVRIVTTAGLTAPLPVNPGLISTSRLVEQSRTQGLHLTRGDRYAIAATLKDVSARYGIPGMAAGVVVGGQVVTATAGVRQRGSRVAVQANDTFQNGSTTKAMTATLVGILVERGVLRWNTKIGEVLTDLKGKVPTQRLDITVEQLLQHRSGLVSDDDASPELQAAALGLQGTPRQGRAELMAPLLNEPGNLPPGGYRYSNAGYATVAAMLERLTGRSYETLMRQYVFKPLGMSTATFEPPRRNGDRFLQPVGHDIDGTPVAPGGESYAQHDLPVFDPAGARLRISPGDWSKFIRVHMGLRVNGVRLLQPSTLAQLHKPASQPIDNDLPYASGWVAVPAGAGGRSPALGPSIWHDGSDNFWLATVEIFPDRQFAVFIMSNTSFDTQGRDLGATAFAEVGQSLIARFANRA